MHANQGRRRIAIVTGASRSQGIGAAVCRALAEMEVDVFFTYWQAHDQALYGQEEEGPYELLSSLRKQGIQCECLEVDLSLPQSAGHIMDEVETRLGTPSILVNNAAHDDRKVPFDQLNADILDTYYAVNMRGTILLSAEFARRFSFATGGHIINLTSGQGVGAMPGKIPYIATKGAIEAFTVTLAAEVASQGITVNAVDPGPTDTGWISADPELKRAMIAQAPFGRIGQPEDAARLIAFLASDAAEWITGQIIHSRGGF
ncbi:3-ketoacyl-ACP reductase [Ktedonobacter sp. SOSP1-85]|uniref:SDR family oxidoreductase n=1 Tax=Ktedonobacter sp. SOSP1-85 TaxID=2778367 RepID=UPI001915590C|nr:SDR family oxidoreductase [Ktedonobacter sp. SOSP1-85]GHO80145.1 3-ketoacyl-ACP reductase [Ktedonobacter sp. SOSP1-85]